MTPEQFRDEVTRRVMLETQRIEAEMRARNAPAPPRLEGGPVARPVTPLAALVVVPAPTAAPTEFPVQAAAAVAPPVPSPEPETPVSAPPPAAAEPAVASVSLAPAAAATAPAPAVREGSLVPLEDLDAPPRIATLVKPTYPRLALKARIGGIVVLRVLVSERGLPLEVQVARKAPAGLDQAAVTAVKRWTFTPPLAGGVPVRTWMTVPIPFEP
jgi:protein TonB